VNLFRRSYDGGPDSGVTGYWLIEWKPVFSIVLLHFSPGSRKAFHSHAFNALTLWLKGRVVEQDLFGPMKPWGPGRLKYTSRNKFHKVIASPEGAWALSIRGPWRDVWQEYKENTFTTLAHGRIPA
jgi:hypothetical protein